MKNNSSLAAHFAKRNTKNCGGEKRSGESEGGPRRRNFVSLWGKQKFFLFACPVASRGLCYGARPSVQFQFRSKKVRISSNKRTSIKLSGILPIDSAAQRAAELVGKKSESLILVPGVGLEPTRITPHNFKSCAAANYATRA